MPPPEPPDSRELEALLNQWSERTPMAPRPAAPEVWRRLAADETPRAETWLERVHAAFARPSFATAFVAACVLLGLFLAETRSSRQQAEYGTQLAQSYLRLIDPLLNQPGRVSAASSAVLPPPKRMP